MHTSEQNYKMIRETAMELFRERGFDNVTVKDICDASGVPRRSFYTLFPNKDSLILSYFDLSQNLLSDISVFSEIVALNDAYTKLMQITRLYLELMEKEGRKFLSQIFRIGSQSGSHFMTDAAGGVKELTIRLLEECQKDGAIQNLTDPESLWETCDTFFIGLCYLWCNAEEPFSLVETGLQKMETILNTRPERCQYDKTIPYLNRKA